MSLDTLIKKFFPVVIGAALALIAYFQASGLVQLVSASALNPRVEELASGSLRPSRVRVPAAAPRRSARPIIAHNPFDHETDLNPKPVEPEAAPPEEPTPVGFDDPLRAERCAGVIVHIVTESTDREWSISVLQGPGEDHGTLRRVGDSVGDFKVEYIGHNWLQGTPAVWLSKDKNLCQAFLFSSEEPPPAKKEEPEKTAEEETEPPKTRTRGAPDLPQDLADKIEKVSTTEFNIDRAVIDNVLENQAQLMRSARIVPEKGADGKIAGIRLFGVRPKTLLGTLGLQNGDRLETINGFEMASPEKALEAYARLRTAPKLTVQVTRRGKPLTLDFNIK